MSNLLNLLPVEAVKGKIVLSDYPTEYYIRNASNRPSKIRTKYYKAGDKIPEKYRDIQRYDFDLFPMTVDGKRVQVEFLIDLYTGDRVIKNTTKAGKERFYPINGSDLHTLRMTEYQRSSIIWTIKDFVKPLIKETLFSPLFQDSYPLKAHFLFHTNTNQDLGNHFPFYEKAIMDAFVDEKILPNDSKHFINGLWFDMENQKEGKNILEIRLIKL